MALAYDPNFFNQAQGSLQQAASAAMPTDQLRDTAASRIRARLAGQQQGQEQQLQDQFAGRGRSTAGAYGGDLSRLRGAASGALASGLADNENNYLQAQQKGAEILRGIGEGQTALGIGQNNAARDFGQLNIDTLRQGADQRFQEGTLGENADRRKAEMLIESLKTFGQYGNVSGEKQYPAFANAIKTLFGQQGISIPDFSTGTPPAAPGAPGSPGATPPAGSGPNGSLKVGDVIPPGTQLTPQQIPPGMATAQGPQGMVIVPKPPAGKTWKWDFAINNWKLVPV